jgi:outer membrane protein TolC
MRKITVVASSSLRGRGFQRIAPSFYALLLGAALSGCAYFAAQPEINPSQYAPHAMDQSWQPKTGAAGYIPPPVSIEALESAPHKTHPLNPPTAASTGPEASGTAWDLAALIDLALLNNPRERAAWESTRAAAASYGSSRAPYYPLISADADSGYTRLQFQIPDQIGVVKQWTSDPSINVTYTLLDFGRRSANAAAARERLATAGFSFNRVIQDVVFSVEQAYYALAAADAAVVAAQQNLDLAQADYESAGQRMNLGLATAPEYLLAKEQVAEANFQVANADLIVHDAQANLAVAVGIPANQPLPIETLERLPLPSTLGSDVEALIEAARRQRPDLAAQMANTRTREAELAEAKAQWYPTLQFNGGYGQGFYDYTFNGPPTVETLDPQYQALVSLKWDLFTGFKRINDIRAAEAQSRAARAQVTSLQLNAYAQVWQAYYQFQSSLTKYQYAQALIDAALEAYAANSETYRQGLSTIVELLTAYRDLANARYTLIQSRADLLTAAAATAYASGALTLKP